MKKFKDKLREECGIFGISDYDDASALVALGLTRFTTQRSRGCGIVSFDGKIITQKKDKALLVITLQIQKY